MQKFAEILHLIDSFIGGSQWFVFLLLGTGLFFTLYLKFPQIRYFKYAIKIVRGKFDQEGDKGDTTHFQALATALSGTVGTGNIAGVALAIHLGGPAALFWMLVTAFLGMTTKFVEVTLSHKYRETAEDGSISGGPMYFMKNRLKMPWLAGIFAVATIFSAFGTGSLPQINSISNSAFSTFGINKILTGAVLAVLLGFVIIGGIKRISKVTSKLVPIMAVIYFFGAITVILYNIENIWPSIVSVFTDVFTGTAAGGGFLGAGFAFAFNRGVNRGLFSNEAGQGSAPIAHAAARAHESVSEGLVALLEPFIDTIIICSLTGLVLLSSGVWAEKLDNQFQQTDMLILNELMSDENAEDVAVLSDYLLENNANLHFNGQLNIENGRIQNSITVFHARSIAEDILVTSNDENYSGTVEVNNGKVSKNIALKFQGKSLVHSAPLTTEAFSRSWFGDWGKYIVTIGLLLFAFSTAISWSYYGDRAVTYLFGVKYVIYFRIIYVLGFFFAAFADTTIIWIFSGITIAFMTIPNLIGILSLSKEMKSEIKSFWKEWYLRFPEEKPKLRK
ncbi:MAG: sodium:alanine symporter family protein [Prolixibacteraceae bacterium]|jgi:AGCS family alanine or glycine:cation symporter|nr:sodium:alanine symporter family protein [Prolixibacteraceae bacterium]